MTFKEQITELGFRTIDFYLRSNLNNFGYEFIKCSIEEYDCPAIEMNCVVTAESKQINKWWLSHFKDEPRRTTIYKEILNGYQFIVDFQDDGFIPAKWLTKSI